MGWLCRRCFENAQTVEQIVESLSKEDPEDKFAASTLKVCIGREFVLISTCFVVNFNYLCHSVIVLGHNSHEYTVSIFSHLSVFFVVITLLH